MSTFFYDNLDPSVRPMRRYYNSNKLVFDNPDEKSRVKQPGLGSRIIVETANSKGGEIGRSFAFQSVHMSEFAFWKDPGKAFDSIMGAVPNSPDSFVTVESTPNGAGGPFYDLWREHSLLRGKGEWLPIFIPFWLDPTYTVPLTRSQAEEIMGSLDTDEERYVRRFKLTAGQLAWRRMTISGMYRGSVEKFNQEMAPTAEECFLVKGDSVFHKESLRYFMNRARDGERGFLRNSSRGIEFVADGTGPLTIWKRPVPGGQYVIGADSAWGVADGDYSAMQVFRQLDKPEQVAEFHAQIPPHEFADQAIMLGKYYQQALIMPESTGTGSAFVFALRDRYPRLGVWERLNTRSKNQSDNIGWDQNKRSQQVMRGEMTSAIYSRDVEIYSSKLIREMSTYVYKDDSDSMGAVPGEHDDLVIAFGLALMGLKQIPNGKLGVSYAPDDSPIVTNNLWTPHGVTGVSALAGSEDWMML